MRGLCFRPTSSNAAAFSSVWVCKQKVIHILTHLPTPPARRSCTKEPLSNGAVIYSWQHPGTFALFTFFFFLPLEPIHPSILLRPFVHHHHHAPPKYYYRQHYQRQAAPAGSVITQEFTRHEVPSAGGWGALGAGAGDGGVHAGTRRCRRKQGGGDGYCEGARECDAGHRRTKSTITRAKYRHDGARKRWRGILCKSQCRHSRADHESTDRHWKQRYMGSQFDRGPVSRGSIRVQVRDM